MSQRSAVSAAASATALVSDPPRPSVAMRPVLAWTPWKPETTATSWADANPSRIPDPSISTMRAAPCRSDVLIGICQPCHERAASPSRWSTMASSPEVTCSPDATTTSYSAGSWSGLASCTQPTSSLVLPDIAETTTATS